MLMGITIYTMTSLGILVVAPLYGTAQDSPSGIPALTLDSVCSCSCSGTEHFNCTLILKWKLSHLVWFRSF
jgi:hypothetical protein